MDALLKYSPSGINKIMRLRKGRRLLLVALNDLSLWYLQKHSLKGIPLKSYSLFNGLGKFHSDLFRQYSALIVSKKSREGFDFKNLFANHLCWEIQRSYYLICSLNAVVGKYKINKIISDSLPRSSTSRHSWDLNKHIRAYCETAGISYEVF